MKPMRFVVVAAAALLALAAIGCGGGSSKKAGGAKRGPVDGTYRVTTNAKELAGVNAPGESADNWGTWTLVLDGSRFAFTRENDEACTWAYGTLALKRNVMDWTVVDATFESKGAANEPGDRYRFKWSRFRDVLTLRPATSGRAGYFAVKPWRRVAETPSAKDLSGRCPPPGAALQPTGAEGVTARPGVEIDASGDLTKTSPARWEGDLTARQLGRGRLTVEGNVVFQPPVTRDRLNFKARFSKGELRGCAINSVLSRPHARYVWDGSGQITGTSPALRKYLALSIGVGAITKKDDLEHARFNLATRPGGVC
jgi:hypothetical protein